MGPIGLPELLFFVPLVVIWAAPIVAAVWAIWTLRKIRATQVAMEAKLEALERSLR
jgi:hypothetical protein